jgi:hypothetical protein
MRLLEQQPLHSGVFAQNGGRGVLKNDFGGDDDNFCKPTSLREAVYASSNAVLNRFFNRLLAGC